MALPARIQESAPETLPETSPTPVVAVGLRGDDKRHFVRGVFDRLAGRYDAMNLLISLGQTSWWRWRSLKALPLHAGMRILDVGCGTGWVVRHLAGRAPDATIEGMDLSEGMLIEARARDPQATYFQGDVTDIPREDGSYDLVTTVFTLRNFPDLDASLDDMVRVLGPGGRIFILDGFPPQGPALWRGFHALWMRHIVPLLVRPFADHRSFRYLAESILRHVTPDEVARRLEARGLTVERIHRFGLGSAAAITARRAS
ncbi:MAG: class I SAM-dependent methyltransferase [Deltaproteobacteria bacterium]|nr:class I SAM-dependent methyltransferase [Deltaproteobacteria bacterium]